jgi:hypothetical protein
MLYCVVDGKRGSFASPAVIRCVEYFYPRGQFTQRYHGRIENRGSTLMQEERFTMVEDSGSIFIGVRLE